MSNVDSDIHRPELGQIMSKPAPKLVAFVLVSMPYLFVLGALTPPQMDNWLPATSLFEGLFFVAALAFIFRLSRRIAWSFFALVIFAAIHMGLALASGSTPLDEIFRAHKWILYLIGLCLFVGQSLPDSSRVARLTKFLIIAAFFKYFYAVALLGLNARPAILTENNYELFLLIGLLVVCYRFMGQRVFNYVILLGLEILVSGSRSAAIGFVIFVFFVTFSGETGKSFRRYLWALLSIAVVWIPLVVFQSRNTSLDTLDRINFLNHFLIETSGWHLGEWLFGAAPMTQLSSSTCQSLSYYYLLLSSAQDGSCYSVILHSFFLRVIFDFGVLGMVATFVSLWIIMRVGGVDRGIAIALVALAVANGFSVSGPNNVYVILPVAYAILVAQRSEVRSGASRNLNQEKKRSALAW